MNLFMDIFECLFSSRVLTGIAFGLVSVAAYIFLMRVNDERCRLVSSFVPGVLLLALSALIPGADLTDAILKTTGIILIVLTPVIAFRGYLHKKDEVAAVFLISLAYVAYFYSTQYMCGGPCMLVYYPWYARAAGDICAPLLFSLSAVAFLIFLKRFYSNYGPGRITFFLLICLIPCLIFLRIPVAAASVAVLVLLSAYELDRNFKGSPGILVCLFLLLAAVIIAFPLIYLAGMPCILNFFPLWIIPVLSVSSASAGIVYALRSAVPEKIAEIVVFLLSFSFSVVLYGFF